MAVSAVQPQRLRVSGKRQKVDAHSPHHVAHDESRIVCSLDGVKVHMLRIHSNVKEDHLRKRIEEDKSIKGRKSTVSAPRSAIDD